MTQPAKTQEPSMEEILAYIRRIISDDEAKPAVAETVAPAPAPAAPTKTELPKAEITRAAPSTRPPVMAGIPPSKIAPARPAAAAPPPQAAPAAEKNNQAEIDAMMASFDAPAPVVAAPAPAPAPVPVAKTVQIEIEPDADVFELTEQMALPDLPQPSFQKIEPEDDLEFTESPVAPVSSHRSPAMDPPAFAEPAPSRERLNQQMMSNSTVSAVESAFNALATTVLSNNARTLEDLVKEMLRPMLKSWLDDNLPNLVERIVKAEIERVSRGSR
jgi:cell pole-organizing protein PopZ